MQEVTHLKPIVKRGEIYYIKSYNQNQETVGSEQRTGRPAVIVSNNMNNTHSATLEIVYLTLQDKKELPTHVKLLRGECHGSTILCEQVTSISVDRLGEYKERVDDETMEKIDRAIMISLDLERYFNTKSIDYDKYAKVMPDYESMLKYAENKNDSLEKEVCKLNEDIDNWKIKYNEVKGYLKYKEMYDVLIDKLISK